MLFFVATPKRENRVHVLIFGLWLDTQAILYLISASWNGSALVKKLANTRARVWYVNYVNKKLSERHFCFLNQYSNAQNTSKSISDPNKRILSGKLGFEPGELVSLCEQSMGLHGLRVCHMPRLRVCLNLTSAF